MRFYQLLGIGIEDTLIKRLIYKLKLMQLCQRMVVEKKLYILNHQNNPYYIL